MRLLGWRHPGLLAGQCECAGAEIGGYTAWWIGNSAELNSWMLQDRAWYLQII